MGTKARGEENRVWVVYSDFLEPPPYEDAAIGEAFGNLLKHVGFAAEWSLAPASTLKLRFAGGAKIQLPSGPHAYMPDYTFASHVDHTRNSEHFARERIMAQVLSEGILGWHGMTRARFDSERSMARTRRDNPEMYDADGILKLRNGP